MTTEEEILALGIDVGTTSIALVVVSSWDGRVISSYSKAHEANLEGIPSGDLLNSKNIEGVIHGNLLSMSEQKVSQILQVVVELIQNLEEKQRERVCYVGG
jgi:cell division ATPase FtsA